MHDHDDQLTPCNRVFCAWVVPIRPICPSVTNASSWCPLSIIQITSPR